uniref:Desmoplakin n=1 Tax=Oncorhynchus kisutch TaxID=8019 RepID=A0A8C7HVN1_ONCKI
NSADIEQQLISHSKFHSSIQRSPEVDKAKFELVVSPCLSLCQKMSHGRSNQLREMQQIIEAISRQIMWVNVREEEELVFDWGDKNIDLYIPKKQESYSKLMSDLEEKEKDLNKLKLKVDSLLKNPHPASDKIEAYMDTLQTQWSWLLQITKCIHVHLKENAAYSEFFKEANEMYNKLQKAHENIRKKFTSDRNTPLENLLELLEGLEKEKERIMENKRQVQHLVNKSKSIVRLRPRNPEEEKSCSPVMVQALCDFKQDQKVILKGNEGILKDNSQRSKWQVTGPGGLDMLVPSVCLLVPPPNSLGINMANKNEQYYEAILSVWNQLYINIKSLISWQYYVQDLTRINSLTVTMLSRMRPEEYRSILKSLEAHYSEFTHCCHGSEMFKDEDKRSIESQYTGAHAHYDRLLVQLPEYYCVCRFGFVHVTKCVCFPQSVQRDVDSIREEYLRLNERVLKELENMTDSDKATFLHSQLGLINERLGSLNECFAAYLQRLRALRVLLQSVSRAEDIIKVHEARLTEKETTSLNPAEVGDYRSTLKSMRAELEGKSAVLVSMETELGKAVHWNGQVGGAFHRCDVDLSIYSEQVNQLSDRWRRIQSQLDSRLRDLEGYLHLLQQYTTTSSVLSEWIGATRQKHDALQATKIDSITALDEHLNQQKVLNSEIKGKRESVVSVLGDTDACVNSIKDYELELASYSAGLETLLNIPMKRTMLQSPSTKLTEETTLLQTRYIELLTLSGDYNKYLGELHNNMETLKTSCLIQSTETQYNKIEMERDALLLKLKQTNQDRARSQELEEELNHMKVSLESESRIKLCLQEENEKVCIKDFLYWKGQYESKEGEVRQFNSEKEKMERERSSLKTEIERLMRELREVEERYKSSLLITQTQFSELTSVRDSLEAELSKLRERPYAFAKHTQTDESGKKDLDPATLVFEGVRKMVTAKQLLDCGVINKVTYGQLLNGQKTVREVSVDIKLNLKGTGSISGVAVGPQGKMSLTEAKRENILSEDSAILLLEAQAATGHIVDPRANEKMTVQEACKRGVVYEEDRERLLIAEAACLGYRDPNTTKLLSAGQAMRKGLIDRVTALRMLQAQESVGGIIDPVLSVFLSKDAAMDRDLIDEDLYRALNQRPECYLDPDTQLGASYVSLKRRCKAEPTTGLLILPAPEKPMTVNGLRGEVSVTDLMSANLLEKSDMDQLKEGKLTSQDIEHRLRSYLRGSTCIAGVYNEANDKTLSIYQAMKEGLLKPSTTLELLEAQAASGFMIDPVNNLCLTVVDAYKRGLAGPEFKDKLLSAERAVTGYKDPGTDKIISLFQAIEKGLIEKGHGIHLLEAQIASGGIIDPRHSHRIEVVTAYKKGYFSKEMNQILTDEGDNSKGFFDPNNQDNLTYLQLKKRCIIDQKTGLVLLSIKNKKEPPQPITQKSTQRKRRVVIVDPDTNKDMSVKEAYDNGLIDHEMFLELSQQECEWEEITITTQDGSKRLVIFDRKTEIQYDIRELLEKSVINQSLYDQYRSQMITLTQFADIVTSKTKANRSSASSSSSSSTSSSKARAAATSAAAYSSLLSSSTTYSPRITSTSSTSIKAEKTSSIIGSSTIGPSSIGECSTITRSTTSSSFTQPDGPSSPSTLKHIASISVSLACPAEAVVLDGEQSPVGAIFDMEALEKISISEAHKRGLVDSISAQRLLEAQACTGGIVNPSDGRRLSIQEASSQGIIENDMATRLKPAQKAYIGFEDIKCKHKMSAAEAMREKWLPYEAGHRFLEFQFVTGGLYDPELGRRRTIKEALKEGWLDGRGAQKLQDTRHHAKNLTCPKTKLKISYKEAMDNCLVEENTGVKMLQAASASSRGISSPYNSSTPGSKSGSRTGSRASSRRGSLDLGSSGSSRRYSIVSSTTYSRTSFSSSSMS